MLQRLPIVLCHTLLWVWLVALISLGYLVHSSAGTGDGLVESYQRERALVAWSRGELPVTRGQRPGGRR